MSDDDEVPAAVHDAGSSIAPSAAALEDALATRENVTLLLVEAKTLVAGLRYLQQRIPDYGHLSARETQSLMRTAYLDPEFVDVTIHAAGAWDGTKALAGRGAEELRREADEARQWDEVERELLVLAKGVAAANLKRKHRLGRALLDIYAMLGSNLKRGFYSELRPYYEEMKRAYLRRRKKSAKADAPAE
jgi:hypothetical protein